MQGNIRMAGFVNTLQSMLLLGAMASILSMLGWFIAGTAGAMFAAFAALMFFILAPNISPALVLRAHRAAPLSPYEFERLHGMTRDLARAAGLNYMPALFYVPDSAMNAFTVGGREKPVIALTDGILRNLNEREIRGVLAHEISHIQNDDIRILGLAGTMNRIINFAGTFGGLFLLLGLPFLILSGKAISPALVLLLLAAPVVSMLLQQALSRTREYDADRNAALLTGDPAGLGSALRKISRPGRTLWDLVGLRRPAAGPALLQSHPPVEKRLERLAAMSGPEPETHEAVYGSSPFGRRVVYEPVYIARQPRYGRVIRI